MFGTDSLKWKEIFGIAWQKIAEVCPEMGAFIIFHETQEVVMDENAVALADMEQTPTYNGMLNFLGKLPKKMENGVQLISQILEYNDLYTAGIIKRQGVFSDLKKKSILPVCDSSHLIIEMSRNKSHSLLALVEFELPDNRTPSEYQMFAAVTAILKAAPKNILISIHSASRFWLYIPDFEGESSNYLSKLQLVMIKSINEEKMDYIKDITFSAGIGSEDSMPSKRMSTAEFALYEANLNGKGSIVCYSSEQYESSKGEYEQMSRFLRLVNDNLFMYHFQPIVSAKDGEIIAYEMLMRSDSSINMHPLEILDCAEKAKRLYDIEKATMTNALSIIGKHQEELKTRKLFVNSITAYMLTDKDWNELESEYGELMEKMVIEFTEQTEINDQSIEMIRNRLGRRHIKIAIDDYGTGYSNTSNLIRYNPDYVKIDRALIEGIDSKPKIRKLVLGIVEFIHENGYQALAEGVETSEELKTVIQLGCDLIQGYYVSKPKPVMLLDTSENVRSEIAAINIENAGNISSSYHPSEGETVDLCRLAADGYNSVLIDVENVLLTGSQAVGFDIAVVIKNGAKTNLTLEDVYLKTERESPVIAVGDGSEVFLTAKGENRIEGHGIYVPQKSSLRISGGGDLTVISNMENCYAIGTDINSSPGNIIVELSGKLCVEANGDNVIAIGGGKNDAANVISILQGDIAINCSGRYCLGIGIAEGGSNIDINNCSVSVNISSPDNVGIGSFKNNVDIEMKNFRVTENLCGINIAGVGTISEGSGRIMISDGSIDGVMKARVVNGIGSRKGNLSCHVLKSDVRIYSEGGSVSGIGDMYGSGDVVIDETSLDFEFLTGDGFAFGSRSGRVENKNTVERININS